MYRRNSSSRLSTGSGSDGYATPSECPEDDRFVRFASAVEEVPPDMSSSQQLRNDDDHAKHSHRLMFGKHEMPDSSDTGHDELGDSEISGGHARRRRSRYKLKRGKLGKSCAANCFRKFPRCYALVVGIIIPLWVLVLISLLFGLCLGHLESELELDSYVSNLFGWILFLLGLWHVHFWALPIRLYWVKFGLFLLFAFVFLIGYLLCIFFANLLNFFSAGLEEKFGLFFTDLSCLCWVNDNQYYLVLVGTDLQMPCISLPFILYYLCFCSSLFQILQKWRCSSIQKVADVSQYRSRTRYSPIAFLLLPSLQHK